MADEKNKKADLDKVLARANKYKSACMENVKDIRTAATRDLQFLAGNQWDEVEKRKRLAKRRACLTFNRLNEFVRQIVGDMLQSHCQPEVQPFGEESSPEIASILDGRIRDIEYQSNASFIYADAGKKMAVCSFGYFRIVTEYEDDGSFQQVIRVKRIPNQFSVYLYGSEEPTGEGCKAAFVLSRMSKDDFKTKYPKAKATESFAMPGGKNDASLWIEKENVVIGEYLEVTESHKEIALLKNGKVVDLDKAKKDEIEQTRTVSTKSVNSYIMNGQEIIDGPFKLLGTKIPIVQVEGPELIVDGKKTILSGIRHALDPQMMYNYMRTAIAEFAALVPKAPYLAEQSQFPGKLKTILETANEENYSAIFYKFNPEMPNIPPPTRQAPPSVPTGLIEEANAAVEDMKAATGIHGAGLGEPGTERSGKQVRERKVESDNSTYLFHFNWMQSIAYAYRIMLELIPLVDGDRDKLRLRKQDNTEHYIPLNTRVKKSPDGSYAPIPAGEPYAGETSTFDLKKGKYQVRVKTGPSYTTQRDDTSDFIQGLMTSIGPDGKAFLPLLLKYKNFEGHEELEAIAKKMNPGLYPPKPGENTTPPPPTPEQQLDQAKLQTKMEAEKTKRMGLAVKTQAHQVSMAKVQKEMAELGMSHDENIQQNVLQVLEGLANAGVITVNTPGGQV